jgi:hypothetical protein
VFVAKCVTVPYGPGEIDVVESFVRAGGCLVMIGDHTDGLMMNSNLEPLALRFGMRFRRDSTYMLDGGWLVTTCKDLSNHPANSLVDVFFWANGCTLEVEPPALPLIRSPWTSFSEPGRYHVENFFGDKLLDSTDRIGRSTVAAVAEVGSGRVFAFTDSTCFNNELLFTEGRRALIHSVLGWFALGGFRVPAGLAPCLLVLALWILRPRPATPVTLALTLLLTVPFLAVGLAVSTVMTKRMLAAPLPVRPLPQSVVVEAGHDPRQPLVLEGPSRWRTDCVSLVPLIGDLGRLPFFPEVVREPSLEARPLSRARLLVVAGPRRPFEEAEKARVSRFVSGGGGLLLIEGAGSNGAINSLAHIFGLEFATGRLPFGSSTGELSNATRVSGGRPLVSVGEKPVVVWTRSGRGLVIGFGDDQLLGAETERRDTLGLGRLIHDLASTLCVGAEPELALRELTSTLVGGRPYR